MWLFQSGHWLFAYKYFSTALMFGRKNKSKEAHEKRIKFSLKIKYLGLALITINYLVYTALLISYRVEGKFWKKLYKGCPLFKAFEYTSSLFFIVDCLVCFAGLGWICTNLKRDPLFKANTKWIAIHSFWLVLITVSFIFDAKNLKNFDFELMFLIINLIG